MIGSAQFLASGIDQFTEVGLCDGTEQFQEAASAPGSDQFRADGIERGSVLEVINSMVGNQVRNCPIPAAWKCTEMSCQN